MSKALIFLNSGQTPICERGESLDDKEAADALLREVIEKRKVGPTEDSFIRGENDGGFDAKLVTGITVAPAPQGALKQTEEVP